jgi:glycine oxidase
MSSTRPLRSSPDLLVIGAGAVGLWTAWKAVQAGMSVTVLDKAHVGAGASGGVLGALMPHRPSQWTASKQFQLEALSALAGEIAQVEAASGLSCGYRRCGRLMPIDSERRLQEHRELAGRDGRKLDWRQRALGHSRSTARPLGRVDAGRVRL